MLFLLLYIPFRPRPQTVSSFVFALHGFPCARDQHGTLRMAPLCKGQHGTLRMAPLCKGQHGTRGKRAIYLCNGSEAKWKDLGAPI